MGTIQLEKQRRIVLWILSIMGLIYFGIFIFPNLTGAKDVTMLSVFEHDEFAQYPNLIHMLLQGDTLKQTLHNFLVYVHYYYGYPFYFISALSILPLKWVFGSEWTANTQTIVAWLKQFINVLPILIAVFFLIRDQIKSSFPWKAIVTYLLLLSLPAVVQNNLWWHPDSLLTLFSVLTLFFLLSDNGKFGFAFYLSGFTCALAIGSKILGVLFIFTYISYLLYGVISKKITARKMVVSGLLFLVFLAFSILITNPLLLFPIERGEIISIFKENLAQSSQGFWVAENGSSNHYQLIFQTIKSYYGGISLFLVSLGLLLAGIFQKEYRLKYMLILTWILGYLGYFIFFATTIRPHYFIPAILPLYSIILDWIPGRLKNLFSRENLNAGVKSFISFLIPLVLIFTLIGINLRKDINIYSSVMNREKTSKSIALFRSFESDFLIKLPPSMPLILYRDWRAYVADNPHWQVIYDWGLANYDYIKENKPDFLFIEFENEEFFSNRNNLVNALDKAAFQKMYDFYADAKNSQIAGYQLIYRTSFGDIFVRNLLFEEYYKK